MVKLALVWESYERNGDGCCAFLTQELAENHDLFEVGQVVQCYICLSDEGIAELESGKPVW